MPVRKEKLFRRHSIGFFHKAGDPVHADVLQLRQLFTCFKVAISCLGRVGLMPRVMMLSARNVRNKRAAAILSAKAFPQVCGDPRKNDHRGIAAPFLHVQRGKADAGCRISSQGFHDKIFSRDAR